MAFHIKNPETDMLARKVAALKKTGLTETVHTALVHELERCRESRLWSISASNSAAICAAEVARQRASQPIKRSATAFMRMPDVHRRLGVDCPLDRRGRGARTSARLQQTGKRLTSPLAVWGSYRGRADFEFFR